MSFLYGQSGLIIWVDMLRLLTFRDKPKHIIRNAIIALVIVLSLYGIHSLKLWYLLPAFIVFKKKLKQFDLHNAANLMFSFSLNYSFVYVSC